LPSQFKPDALLERNGSDFIAADGRYLAGLVFDKDVILPVTLDFEEIKQELMTLDVSGQYSCPDIFQLDVK
jgi:hypothetical protein